jgi:hypothetical protein
MNFKIKKKEEEEKKKKKKKKKRGDYLLKHYQENP